MNNITSPNQRNRTNIFLYPTSEVLVKRVTEMSNFVHILFEYAKKMNFPAIYAPSVTKVRPHPGSLASMAAETTKV